MRDLECLVVLLPKKESGRGVAPIRVFRTIGYINSRPQWSHDVWLSISLDWPITFRYQSVLDPKEHESE